VDETKIPPAGTGQSVPRIGPTDNEPHVGDGIGAFRTNCRPSHMSFDDPIVFPGRARATHLHAYFGNTRANASSTPTSIRTTGSSTCTGGTLNRSAYWAPAVIDTRDGSPVLPGTSQHDKDYALQIYYKTGYDGIRPDTVQNFPQGLRMIAGTSSSKAPQPGIIEYSCTAADGSRSQVGAVFPACAAGALFIMAIKFPQCWDGVNLDSPDHKSHMAYGLGWHFRGCPASHPVPLTQITQHFRYRVPAGGMTSWRLSSDMYDGPAGYSGHADWMNGWDTATFQRIVTNCFRPGLDCELDLLGDGYTLLR
jgi:hypothetical protein